MASWGDINAALNRLVREGVIAGFRTNRGEKLRGGAALHVSVVPAAPDDDPDDLRKRLMDVLTPLDAEVTVSVAAEIPTA